MLAGESLEVGRMVYRTVVMRLRAAERARRWLKASTSSSVVGRACGYGDRVSFEKGGGRERERVELTIVEPEIG